jgi:hypothetical protein
VFFRMLHCVNKSCFLGFCTVWTNRVFWDVALCGHIVFFNDVALCGQIVFF